MMKFNEAMVLVFVSVSSVTRSIVKGFASEPWMYYLGAMIDLVDQYGHSIVKSFMSCCVPGDELAKVLAFLSCIESLIPVIVTQLYASVWKVKCFQIKTVNYRVSSFRHFS